MYFQIDLFSAHAVFIVNPSMCWFFLVCNSVSVDGYIDMLKTLVCLSTWGLNKAKIMFLFLWNFKIFSWKKTEVLLLLAMNLWLSEISLVLSKCTGKSQSIKNHFMSFYQTFVISCYPFYKLLAGIFSWYIPE